MRYGSRVTLDRLWQPTEFESKFAVDAIVSILFLFNIHSSVLRSIAKNG